MKTLRPVGLRGCPDSHAMNRSNPRRRRCGRDDGGMPDLPTKNERERGFQPSQLLPRRKFAHAEETDSFQVCGSSATNPIMLTHSHRFLQRPVQSSPSREIERLPAMNYSLLKDNQLRKKFRELGIPEWGTRPLLIRRHTEWMNLWNANSDSRNPKVKRDLLKELDTWEKTQGGRAAAPSSLENNSIMRKDFNADEWSASHSTDFKRLVANARKRSNVQAQSTTPDTSRDPESEKPVQDPSVRTEEASLSIRASAEAKSNIDMQSLDPSR